MKSLKIENGSVKASRYILNVDRENATAEVIIAGTAVVNLDLRSGVNSLDDENKTVTDSEPCRPVFTGEGEESGKYVFRFKGKSSLWEEKIYTIVCDSQRFSYTVTVKGKGRVDGVFYYSGDLSNHVHGSDYEFSEGFNPCLSWYDTEDYYFKTSTKNHRWSVLMTPPMFCYSFRTEGIVDQIGFGIVAKKGEHNFHSMTYHYCADNTFTTKFCISTDQHGHTVVDGEWESPAMITYGAYDEFEVLRLYRDYYYSTGIAETRSNQPVPRFWKGPMVCGWIQQMFGGRNANPPEDPTTYATQAYYETIVDKIHKFDLHPQALIIDDKWQTNYGIPEVNKEIWPDMRAFIDARHKEGINTMLWFKLWDCEGVDEKYTVVSDSGERRIDPSNPEYLKLIDECIYKLVSSDKGCCDCDGFKLDFALFNPIGRGFKTYSGKYGVELQYEYQKHIYETVKKIKPYALINCSPCHPYYAHICDQSRLHDYNAQNRNNLEDLSFRAKLFKIANPLAQIDTDNAGFHTNRDSMRYLLSQPNIGVPDLYALEVGHSMSEEDYYAISEMWAEYSRRIDLEYGE